MKQFSSEDFQAATGVSRETLDRLRTYAVLLQKRNRTLNLVSASTIPDLWHRHFFDSAQLAPLAPVGARAWLDIGSGAGFPGLVLAIVGAGEVHLVERSRKKAAFLREVVEATGATAVVHALPLEELTRLELAPDGADVVTARAVAPPLRILELARPFEAANATYLLPVGRNAESALTDAREYWKLTAEILSSRTDQESGILRFRKILPDRPPRA